jgi:hypothetical protein
VRRSKSELFSRACGPLLPPPLAAGQLKRKRFFFYRDLYISLIAIGRKAVTSDQ